VLAISSSLAATFAGIALWGFHLALTQGLLAKLVAEHAAVELRATAFGLFHLASATALLAASVIAGALWDRHGPDATFAAGAVFALAAIILVLCRR
jgi:predicted MFS family arabinose efflux permease